MVSRSATLLLCAAAALDAAVAQGPAGCHYSVGGATFDVCSLAQPQQAWMWTDPTDAECVYICVLLPQ